jgi:septum formation protein
MAMQLILASASPRRSELLTQLGVEFEIKASDIPEDLLADETPEDYVQRIAKRKANVVYQALNSDQKQRTVVLGGDTCVLLGKDIMGKPCDRLDALAMLARLSGREHRVLSAVYVISSEGENLRLSQTSVRFRNLTLGECEAYWKTGEPIDKAGAYGIQGLAAAFVESITGSYSGVVGLPLAETYDLLRWANISTSLTMPQPSM